MENTNFGQTKKDVSSKTSSKLRDMLRNIDFLNADAAKSRGALSARSRISRLLDEGTFVEIGAYVKSRSDDAFSGIICGYGAVDGRLVFVFAQDFERSGGTALDEFYTKKVLALYDMAIKNGAPVVGIFDSTPDSSAFFDVTSLAGFGKILCAVNSASGVVPQIAVITGRCDESFCIMTSMFDFMINADADNYLINKNAAILCENEYVAVERAAELIKRLPQNNADGTVYVQNNANINRLLDPSDLTDDYDVKTLIDKISDNNDFFEIFPDRSPEMVTGFIFIGGMSIGVCANRHDIETGIISAGGAEKAAAFIGFCDSFNIPLLTLVDSVGVEKSSEACTALAALSFAYSSSTNSKVSVIIGNSQNLAFTLMGSKSLGTDIVYVVERAKINSSQTDAEGNNILVSDAARLGETDDIIEFTELRKKICAAFEMLGSKSTLPFSKKHTSYTLRAW